MGLLPGDENRPSMYKYRPDNTSTLRILKNQEMYLSFVSDFNDPFDCRITVNCKGTETDWIEYARHLPIPANIKEQTLNYLRSIGFDPDAIMSVYRKQNFKTAVVYCVSELCDNMLMWSHYSNCHKGVCIGFATEVKGHSLGIHMNDPSLRQSLGEDFDNFLSLSKVNYQRELPPPYDIFTGDTAALSAFLKTKGLDWVYEQERRILLPYRGLEKHLVTFAKASLSKVILGCRISPDFRREVLNIIASQYWLAGHAVNVYQADLDEGSYSLKFKKVEVGNATI